MSKYYLAYGSNLNMGQMKSRCPTAKPVGTAFIENYRLLFRGSKTGFYLTIEPCEGSVVPVGVWEVGAIDEYMLDVYEGFPTFYRKVDLLVDFMDFDGNTTPINAFVYIMNGNRPCGMPTNRYFGTCLRGYIDFRFETEFLSKAVKDSIQMMKSEGENE